MSGGISAIKGFDYQAIVILSRLFDHFEQIGETALARPEGADDLDLSWTVDGVVHRRYEQIKKPAEDEAGHLTPKAWTVARAVDDLLPGTVTPSTDGESDPHGSRDQSMCPGAEVPFPRHRDSSAPHTSDGMSVFRIFS